MASPGAFSTMIFRHELRSYCRLVLHRDIWRHSGSKTNALRSQITYLELCKLQSLYQGRNERGKLPMVRCTRNYAFILLCICIFLSSSRFCAAQDSPAVNHVGLSSLSFAHPSSAKQRQAAGRFLGWKYAALAHQDTSQWIRPQSMAMWKKQHLLQPTVTQPLATSAATTSSLQGASFAMPPHLPTGFIPTAVAKGDFNGDGKMDIAISNGGDNTIYVYLGKGDGTFSTPEVLYTKGQSPDWLTTARLRTGGPLDLIAVDGDSKQVEVFLGNGDGTFQPSTIVATLTQTPTFVLAGDFNKDGHIDLAVGLVVDPQSTEPQFQVLLGDGTGAFPSTITPPLLNNTGTAPLPTTWMASGDLNNDGQLDLVVTVAYAGAVAYVNQNGTSFVNGNVFNPSDTAAAVALGDMNGDGCLDAVETGTYGLLTIAKGNCDGTFTQSGPTAELGDVDYAVKVADINGDGKLDVVASSAFTTSEAIAGIGAYGGYLVSVLDGDGLGNVSPAAIYRVGPEAYDFTVADLTGSGYPDIVTISTTESTATLLANNGSGGFGATPGETTGYLGGVTNQPISTSTPQTVDVNGDGKPDIVMIESGKNSTVPSQVTTLLNDGNGSFSPPERSPITVGPNVPFPIFTVGKFRSTSPADLIYLNTDVSPQVAFMPGNGDGTFGTPVTLATLPAPVQVVSGDFNGDGKLDFAVAGYTTMGGYSSLELDVFLGNGDGTFRHLPPQTFPSLTNIPIQQLIAGDFNHDGKLDLLIGYNTNGGWVTSGDDLDLALGNGDGTFQAPTTLMRHFGPVAVADLNHDGYLDLIQARNPAANTTQDALTAAGGAFIAPAVTVYLGGGGGTFTKSATYSAPGIAIPSYAPALVGDFNGDGKLDIAIPYVQSTLQASFERRLQIYQGNGDGTFTAVGIPYQLPELDLPVVGADYLGNGFTDLLDVIGSTSSVNILPASLSSALNITADSSPLTGSQGTATVTLALPPASSQTVQLTSSDPAVTLPSSLTFSAGQTQQTFSFTIGSGFDASHVLAITASLNGQTSTAYFAKSNPDLTPGVTALVGTEITGTSSVATAPGESIPLIFTLQSVDGYSGTFTNFKCAGMPSGTQCTFAQSSVVLLPGGYAQVAFNISTSSSTPTGTYPVTISASNGVLTPSADITLGLGGFSLSVNPTTIPINGSGVPSTTVMANFTNGYSQTVQLSCTGLPSGANCTIPGVLYPNNTSTTVEVSASNVAPQDYGFQIVGTAGSVTSSVNATLRVSGFSASIQPSSATVIAGHTANFTVNLTSLNHFSSSDISISCQSTANVTCSTPSQYASLSDGGTTSVTLSVTPQASTTAMTHAPHSRLPWAPALACILFVLVPTKRFRKRYGLFLFLLALCISSPLACSGGGGGGGGSAQTFSIAITAQSSTPYSNLNVSAGTITLTVTQ